MVNLAPGATLTFTYQAVVGSGVTTGQNLVNVVTFQGLQDSTTTPVELPPVLPIEDEEVVAAEEEEIAATGANNVGNMVGAALLAMLAGGFMVTFGRRRRNQG